MGRDRRQGLWIRETSDSCQGWHRHLCSSLPGETQMQEGRGWMLSGRLAQGMPTPLERQKPRAQTTWLQAPMGLEEWAQNVAMAKSVRQQQAGQVKIAPEWKVCERSASFSASGTQEASLSLQALLSSLPVHCPPSFWSYFQAASILQGLLQERFWQLPGDDRLHLHTSYRASPSPICLHIHKPLF